jgi:hypothetical protein
MRIGCDCEESGIDVAHFGRLHRDRDASPRCAAPCRRFGHWAATAMWIGCGCDCGCAVCLFLPMEPPPLPEPEPHPLLAAATWSATDCASVPTWGRVDGGGVGGSQQAERRKRKKQSESGWLEHRHPHSVPSQFITRVLL